MKSILRHSLALSMILLAAPASAQTKPKTGKTEEKKDEKKAAEAVVLPDGTKCPAFAEQPKPTTDAMKKAKDHYERGASLYRDGDYKLAAIEFQKTYDIAPTYKILFNIGQVQLQLNNYAAARTALERYLCEGGSQVDPKRRGEVAKDLQALRARTARLSMSFVQFSPVFAKRDEARKAFEKGSEFAEKADATRPGPGASDTVVIEVYDRALPIWSAAITELDRAHALYTQRDSKPTKRTPVESVTVNIDDQPVVQSPITDLLIDAGNHRISTFKVGFAPEPPRSISLGGDESKTIEIELKQDPSQDAIWAAEDLEIKRRADDAKAKKAEAERIKRDAERNIAIGTTLNRKTDYTWVGWVGTGAFAAGAVTTGIVAWTARSRFESFRETTDKRPVTQQEIDAANTYHDRAKTMALVTDVLTGAAVVTAGVTLYFTLKKPSKEAAKTSSTEFLLSPAQIGLRGSF